MSYRHDTCPKCGHHSLFMTDNDMILRVPEADEAEELRARVLGHDFNFGRRIWEEPYPQPSPQPAHKIEFVDVDSVGRPPFPVRIVLYAICILGTPLYWLVEKHRTWLTT